MDRFPRSEVRQKDVVTPLTGRSRDENQSDLTTRHSILVGEGEGEGRGGVSVLQQSSEVNNQPPYPAHKGAGPQAEGNGLQLQPGTSTRSLCVSVCAIFPMFKCACYV